MRRLQKWEEAYGRIRPCATRGVAVDEVWNKLKVFWVRPACCSFSWNIHRRMRFYLNLKSNS